MVEVVVPRFTLSLPWPSSRLSPNSRLHWAELSRAKKRARSEARLLTQLAATHAQSTAWIGKAERLEVHLEFVRPDRRRHDADNLVARMKAALDGVAEALGVNDHAFQLRHVIADEIGGCVRLTITPAVAHG